ncbi:hypothetical protein QTQ03_16510 [Micromonospora sp. WMMA1363]|uniref:hypothetical protein n=1 Tax=Micromonospora sp. WMMA1363 TaxID=3053985 RepID=UPI00259CD273|nr:hypothetical protein [Micromonospora sp. WMMA1363]MDM4721121.1 hypothetical protein [Micromonospora sp. WMMA1363]
MQEQTVPQTTAAEILTGLTAVGLTVTGQQIEADSIKAIAAGAKPTPPDYWESLADNLRQAANRVAGLVGTPAPAWTTLDITVVAPQDASMASAAVVDAVAEAIGATALTSSVGLDLRQHKTETRIGNLRVEAIAYLPAEGSELERLRARVAELEAERAEVTR